MEIAGIVARAARDLRTHDRGDPRGRAHARRVGAPEPLVHRRRRASTSRSRASRPKTSARRTTARCGTPGSARCSRPAARSATTTASASTAPGSCADALGAGFDVLHRGEARARPERHPQPRQARPRHARSARSPGRERRERARPRRRRRHEQRARRGRRAPTARSCTTVARELLPDSPADGLVRVRRDGDGARRALDVARAALDGRGPGRRGRHLQPARRRRSCGTARPASPSARPRLAGPAHGRRRASRCAPKASASRRTSRPPRCKWLLDQLDPDRDARPLLRHRRHLDRVDAVGGRAHVTDATQRRGHRPASHARPHASGTPTCSTLLRIPRAHAAGDRRLDGRRRRRRPRSPARRRSPRSLGDQQASLVGQGCVHPGDAKITFGTGGMLDLTLGDDAAAVRRRAAEHGTFPIVAWRARRHDDVGRRSDHARGGHERAVAARRPRAHRRQPTSRTSSPRRCADTGGVVFVPALLGLGTPAWDYGARGALFGLTRGTGPRRDRARGARRHRAPRRRPRRGGRGRRRHRDPDAARRRRHDRQPDVRAGARRRDAAPGRGLAGARGDRARRRAHGRPRRRPLMRSSTTWRRRGRRGHGSSRDGTLDRDHGATPSHAPRLDPRPLRHRLLNRRDQRRLAFVGAVARLRGSRPTARADSPISGPARACGEPGREPARATRRVDRRRRPRPSRPTRRPASAPSPRDRADAEHEVADADQAQPAPCVTGAPPSRPNSMRPTSPGDEQHRRARDDAAASENSASWRWSRLCRSDSRCERYPWHCPSTRPDGVVVRTRSARPRRTVGDRARAHGRLRRRQARLDVDRRTNPTGAFDRAVGSRPTQDLAVHDVGRCLPLEVEADRRCARRSRRRPKRVARARRGAPRTLRGRTSSARPASRTTARPTALRRGSRGRCRGSGTSWSRTTTTPSTSGTPTRYVQNQATRIGKHASRTNPPMPSSLRDSRGATPRPPRSPTAVTRTRRVVRLRVARIGRRVSIAAVDQLEERVQVEAVARHGPVELDARQLGERPQEREVHVRARVDLLAALHRRRSSGTARVCACLAATASASTPASSIGVSAPALTSKRPNSTTCGQVVLGLGHRRAEVGDAQLDAVVEHERGRARRVRHVASTTSPLHGKCETPSRLNDRSSSTRPSASSYGPVSW